MASRTLVAVIYAFIAVAVCPVIFSAPAQRQTTCAPVCNARRSSVVRYEQGKSYIYNFETEVVTQLVGSTDENSRIKVKGQAALAAQSACDLVLTIQQIAITSSNGQAISRVNDIVGSSIRFAYTDGVVDSVCVSEDDPTWSANIKRAIVSMLGNRALSGETETIETDINGKCRTTYAVDGTKYTKTKDLGSCTNRDGGMATAYGVPYTAPSEYHSIPLFNSVLTCVQELGKGIVQSVECNEGHALDVIQSTGVRTDIKSSLTLTNVQSSLVKGHDTNSRSCLLYNFAEHDDSQRQKASASNAVDLLNRVCKEIESGTVSLKVPGLFLQLRKAVKYARKDDLKLIYQQITSGKLCQNAVGRLGKLYLDANGMSAGDGPIAFLSEVLASGDVEESTKDIFLAYTAFATQPGPLALEAVEQLVSSPDAESDYLLAASGLAHQYCRLTNPDCGSNDKYISLVDKIAHHVKSATSREDIEKVVVALQALGNLDSLTPDAVTAVVNLLEDSSTNQRLKVRALDAFRRDSCQETLKQKASKIFSSIKESSQVRIQAYLTLSKCLTPADVPVVQAVIDNDDESNQVGSFVVSHVRNLIESSSPGKLALKKNFELIKLREFPSDLRKYSRNFEISAFDPSLMNSGISVDSNIIFSQDSYIPRTLTTNFTVEAFGRSYNLAEVGINIENFEHVLESLLGPAGALRSVSLDDIIRESADQLSQLKAGISGRFKRDVADQVSQNEIDAIRNEVDIHERTDDIGNGDVYLRILGTSIVVESLSEDGLEDQPLGSRITRAIEKLAEGVQDQKVDITEPFMFMDDEIIIPTSSGLPLTVQTEGTTVLSLQIQGNLDVISLLSGNNGDMRAKIMPSSATVVKAKMILGTGPIESGLQIEGKLHSAAGIDLKVVREDGKFELRANIPQERIQIFDIRSDIYWVEQSVDQVEKKTPVKTKAALKSVIDNQCTTSLYITKLSGLKVCADVKIPQVTSAAPLFFLNGPSVVSLFIEKVEPSMEGFYVKVESINNQDTYGLDFVLDTPGSRTNRKVQAQARAVGPSSATPQYSLKIESPINIIEVNYKRSLTDELKGVELKVAIDGKGYTWIAEVRKTIEGAGYKLTPVIQYQWEQSTPVKLLEGEITRVPGQNLNVNLRTGGPFDATRGSVKGSLIFNHDEADNCDIEYKDLEFTSEAYGKVLLDGFYKRQGRVADFKLDSKYGQTAQHSLSIEARGGVPTAGEKVLKLVTRSSRSEFLNFDLDWKLKQEQNKIEHSLDYTRGLTEPKVVIRQKSEIEIVSRNQFDVESELTIKHPAYNIDFHVEAEAKSEPGKLRHAELELKAGDNVQAKATFEGTGDLLTDYKVIGNLVLGEKTYEVSEVASRVDAHKLKYISRISVTPGFYYQADSEVLFKHENSEFKTDLAIVVKSDQLENPVTLKAIVAAKKEGYGALLKLDAQGKSFLDLQTNHKITKVAGSPTSYTTKMKAHIVNTIDAKLSNTYSNGNGDLVLDALLIKSGRKIAGTSKVQRNGDVYDLKADLKWDAERDPNKAIQLHSLTTLSISELRIDSKNEITVVGKTSRINIKSVLSRDILNGESSAELDYVSPSGKAYNLASKVNLENKQKVRAGRVNLKVTLPDAQPSEIEIGVNTSKLDEQDQTFDIKADLKANYRGEKDIAIHGEASSTLPGNYRSYAGSLTAQGSVLPRPIALSLKTDVKKGRVAIKAESKRGTDGPVRGSLDATIDYDTWSPKKTIGVKYSINTPIDRIQSIEGEYQGSYLFNSLRNFEFSRQFSLALNGGSPYSSSVLLSILENEGKLNYNLVSEGQQVVTLSAEGKLDRRHLRGKLTSDVRGSASKLNLDVTHQLPNIEVQLTGESALVQGVSNFELKLSNKRNADGTHDSELLARSDGEDRLRITNKYENSPQRKAIDVLLASGDEPVKKLFLLFNEVETGKWNVEANAKWGSGGNYLNTKGSLTKRDGAVEGELSLDSPALKANKFSVRVAKSLADGRHGLDITVDGNNQRQLAIGLTYGAKDESNYERSYDGTLKVEGQAVGKPVDLSGKFRLEDTTLDRQRDNGEEGRRIRANVEIITDGGEPMKLNVLAKRSNKENRLQLSLCKSGDSQCRVGDVHLRHTHGSDGNLDYELRIVSEQISGSNKETNGVVLQTRLDTSSKQFEHIAKLIINEEKAEQIGYRLYRNPTDSEAGAEILLPARVIALVATSNKESSGAYEGELAFYVDKTKNADRKISLVVTSSAPTKAADNARSREVEITLKHPDLSKDLRVKTRYAYAGDVTILEFETILDVFKDNDHQLVTTYSVSRQNVQDGVDYKSVFSVISKGLHINLAANGEFKYVGRELSYQNVLTYENREGQVKTSQVLLGVSRQRFIFEIEGADTKLVSFISSYQSHPTGCEIKYEIHLPGMEDTRIIRAIANTVSPRNVQLKSSTSVAPEQSLEVFLGFKSDDELVAGIYDNAVGGRSVLGDVTLALNGSRILSVKSDWNKENARAVLTRVQERGQRQRERLIDLLSKTVEEVVKEVTHVSSNIRSASPDLKVVVTSARGQLTQLKQELEQNPDTKIILDRLTFLDRMLRHFSRVLIELAKTAKRIALSYVSGLKESLKALPEKYSELLERFPEYLESLKGLLNRGIEALRNVSKLSCEILESTIERLSASIPSFADSWNWIVDHTEGLAQVLTEFVKVASEKLAKVYSALRCLADRILANRTVAALLSELRNRLQGLLEEFVEDSKEQLDAIKNYVLSAVPQKEFQEFVEALVDYIQKKASKATVDDAASLRNVYDKLVATIQRALSDVFTIDPSKGIFRARIPLPVSLKSLAEFTKIFTIPSGPSITFRVPAYAYGIRELINQLRSGAAINEIFPPFKGYGLLIGSKHYKTFDGRFFDFEGDCQYLLASDFGDGNFSVVVDYDRQGDVSQKSIIVTDGNDNVALKPDHSVVVNGQAVTIDTPKEAGSFLIERIGDWIVVRGDSGAVVGCSVTQDVCAVKIDGFYHGKVLGLLGTLNQERFDDLRKPNGDISPSVGEFVSSWKLNKQCQEPMIMTTMIYATATAQEKCGDILDSRRSSLRPCYGVVDPTPFRSVCEKLSQHAGYTEEQAVCTAAIGYSKACFMSYATVDPTPACAA
ncbi:unnamed protein product [Orchesella dallaii]|uniref:Apolipophorin n=1 Tax=Orchesella dallaii TaxID=48710 RepID=A0ABP1Q529_9HEXA